MSRESKKFKCIKTLGPGDSAIVGKIYEAYWCDFNNAYVSNVEGDGLCLMEDDWFEEMENE